MITVNNIIEHSNAEIIQLLGRHFKKYRLSVRMTQKEVAEQAGVSVLMLRNFETGKATNITMGNFLALLRAIGELKSISSILPEIPISPYLLQKLQQKQPKRIRHGK